MTITTNEIQISMFPFLFYYQLGKHFQKFKLDKAKYR